MPDREIVFAKVRAALLDVIEEQGSAGASPSGSRRQIEVRLEHHLVEDLGVDSVNIASLTIALEDQFEDVLLLNDWIASASSPSELTVASLVDYLMELLAESG